MKKNKKLKWMIFIVGSAILAVVLPVLLILSDACGGGAPVTYQFATVTRGPIQTTVASTGTISALNTVEVGTQVSGQIAKLHVTYNDHVKKGQILAKLDPTLLENAVQAATADQVKAEAQYELALQDYNNNKLLHDKALISDFDFKTSEVSKDTAYAAKLSAEAALARAKLNLDESVIRAPISGIVIDQAVQAGQTVAASFSAPTLFTIAEDLSNVQITTYVAESDIGSIKGGEKTTFTVTAYPNDTFEGRVDIVHLQPETIQNVVNYVVMVNAVNTGMKLKPGMTATVTFITDERQDALLVPNAVLSFRPTDAQIAKSLKDNPDSRGNGQNGQTEGGPQSALVNSTGFPPPSPALSGAENTTRNQGNQSNLGNSNSQGNNGASARQSGVPASFFTSDSDLKLIWGLNESGKLTATPVRVGISDGQKTEIISNLVTEGMKFISGKGNQKTTTTNQNRGQDFGPPGPF
jgi:HlyD family secretion protein